MSMMYLGMELFGFILFGVHLFLESIGLCLLPKLGRLQLLFLQGCLLFLLFSIFPGLWWHINVTYFVIGSEMPEVLFSFYIISCVCVPAVCVVCIHVCAYICLLSLCCLNWALCNISFFQVTNSFLCPLHSATEPRHWVYHLIILVFQF